MIGTCQTDRCGASALGKADVKAKEIVIGSHESLIYQHNTKSLLYTVWGDNNFVKTLSNFHSPVIIRGGIKREKEIDKPREERGNRVMLIALNNKSTTALHIIGLIRGMDSKLSMYCRLNLMCMDGHPN